MWELEKEGNLIKNIFLKLPLGPEQKLDMGVNVLGQRTVFIVKVIE